MYKKNYYRNKARNIKDLYFVHFCYLLKVLYFSRQNFWKKNESTVHLYYLFITFAITKFYFQKINEKIYWKAVLSNLLISEHVNLLIKILFMLVRTLIIWSSMPIPLPKSHRPILKHSKPNKQWFLPTKTRGVCQQKGMFGSITCEQCGITLFKFHVIIKWIQGCDRCGFL